MSTAPQSGIVRRMNREQGMSPEHPSPPSLDEDLRSFSKELRESWESLMARRAAGLVQTDKEEDVYKRQIEGKFASKSSELAKALSGDKKIVVCTIQTLSLIHI